jgi:HK97 family phage portal protein
MGFLDDVVRGAEFRTTSGLARPANWLSDAFSTGKTSSGQRVTAEKAIGVSSVWAAVSLISETVGSLPLKVFKTVDDDERSVATSHSAYSMLHDRPNPVMPADRFWSTVAAHLLLWGNAFVEKRRRSSVLVDELWLLDPRETTIEWDDSRTKQFVQMRRRSAARLVAGSGAAHHGLVARRADGRVGRLAVQADVRHGVGA